MSPKIVKSFRIHINKEIETNPYEFESAQIKMINLPKKSKSIFRECIAI